MVEPWLIEPDVNAFFHQFMYVVEDTVGGEGNVALGRYHNLYFHATFDGILQRFLEFVV